MRPFSMPLGWCVLPELSDELCCLNQPIEGEQMRRARGLPERGQTRVVGAAHGDRGVRAIREPYDEIRVSPSSDADDLNPLAAERVVGMGDGHESRSRLGCGGSVL
jgi:hypothetical protein